MESKQDKKNSHSYEGAIIVLNFFGYLLEKACSQF